MRSTLNIDLETFSSVDLLKCGLYRYVESPDFQILLMAYSLNEGDVEIVDLTNDDLPREINIALRDSSVIKRSYNTSFERICLSRYLSVDLSADQWECTMTLGMMAGLPGNLAGVAQVLGLKEQKMDTGRALITYFSKPCTPTKSNHNRSRNLPHHDPDKWELFKNYCIQDVKTEMAVYEAIKDFEVSRFERSVYLLDQKMNDLGVRIDMDMVDNLIIYHDEYKDRLHADAVELSGLDNPNSRAQLLEWLRDQEVEIPDLKKKSVSALMAGTDNETVRDLLKMRQELAKTSMSKYDVMQRATCDDGRIHGVLQYYGANRTGRWAGRLVQVQNLPKTNMKEKQLSDIRELVKRSEFEALEAIYGTVSDLFSQLIRTSFIPSPKRRFAVCDYSAIEARVIAYLADEQWRLEVFSTHGKIYEASASAMFKIPLDQVDKKLRSKGKIAELACIAEDELVLTQFGLIPIQDIKQNHKVWDGENFVAHDGLVYRGLKEVINYDGLTATPDHLVYLEGQRDPIYFGQSAQSGSHLQKSGTGWESLRKRADHRSRAKIHARLGSSLRSDSVSTLRSKTMDKFIVHVPQDNKGMSDMHETAANTSMARSKAYSGETALYESKRQGLSKLWRTWYTFRVRLSSRRWTVDPGQSRAARSQSRNGSDRRGWQLRAWESAIHYAPGKPSQQTNNADAGMESGGLALQLQRSCPLFTPWDESQTNIRGSKTRRSIQEEELARDPQPVRVYDIVNAGPNHRFTVSGILVHNCGYGGGKNALIAMGALEMGLEEDELQEQVTRWRKANPRICALWKSVETCAKRALNLPGEVNLKQIHKDCPVDVFFERYKSDLHITLPSGRKLVYKDARVEGEDNYTSITYWGMNQATKKWMKESTWGGKIVENCVQAFARDCLAEALIRLDQAGYRIVFHVHDEVICEVETAQAEASLIEMKSIMGTPINWAPGLELPAEGDVMKFYAKN